MSFSALTLLELSQKAVLETFVIEFEKLAGILPKSVYTALFQKWLACPDNLDLSDDENDKIYDILNETDIFDASGADDPSFLIRRCVMALTKEKYEEYPSFVYINENNYNHVIFEAVVERKIFGGEKNLCNRCFQAESHYTLPFCGNLWDRDKKYYLNIFDHDEVYGNEIFTKYMKDNFYWCSNCNIKPLFKIVDIDECIMQYHDHYTYYSPSHRNLENFFYITDIKGKYNSEMFKDCGYMF